MGKKTSARSASKTSSKKADSASAEKKKKRSGTKFGAKKGKQFEREIATALGHIFPDAQRMLEYQGSNVIGVDLENTDIFRFQCKCTANYKNPNAIFEIREKGPHVPVLVTKANNRPPMAVLPFQEFVTLLEMAYGHRERLINPYQKEQGPGALALVESFPSALISLPPVQNLCDGEEKHLPYVCDGEEIPEAEIVGERLEWKQTSFGQTLQPVILPEKETAALTLSSFL